ncbi:hypothetical protein RclHR1_19160002 [Rhizophagus clarus]|uniref:Uncharacterized protein n=1 Tax=Rhizophagus clarus TaxID=94130 RepID=A0A2Z6QP05_9GLOM|nr:hypothetical protein RclHR1_19160002 [Rhizophagus clarus]GET03906.1 hypothetical protein RCL_jg939.t1 [Rhizophagus clarus]
MKERKVTSTTTHLVRVVAKGLGEPPLKLMELSLNGNRRGRQMRNGERIIIIMAMVTMGTMVTKVTTATTSAAATSESAISAAATSELPAVTSE